MTDVLIKGDGVAAMAAAIALRQQGCTVALLQRTGKEDIRVGESMASSALASLHELGLGHEFLSAGHQQCYGNTSCWGSSRLAYFDFIQSPLGPGWYIDRPRFNAMMRGHAERMGVQFATTGSGATLVRDAAECWQYDTGSKVLKAPMIIDASGRSSWLSRRLGIARENEDRQIAVMTTYTAANPINSRHSLVEAVEDGWWYVATAGDKTICIFFTDADLHERAQLDDTGFTAGKKAATIFVKHRLPADRYSACGPPTLTAAGSSNLAQYAGPGWLAAGDAAFAMDPLTSHGLAFALRSGIDAGLAAAATLRGDADALNAYNHQLQQANDLYREKRREIYGMEQRWAGAEYWVRRGGLS
jgi:flavin-dependent dehydrogenase